MPSRPIRTFTVLPHLPERLQALQKLAYNMWWCWNHEAVALFRRIDVETWEALDHRPVKLLSALDPARVEQLLQDDGFLAHMDRVEEAFDNYMSADTWYRETYADPARNGIQRPRSRVAHRLLFRRVRHSSERAGLFRRSGRVVRRSSQKRQRSGPAAHGRRSDVPRRLFPPVSHRRWLAAGTLSGKRFLQSAAHRRDQPRWRADDHSHPLPRPRCPRAHLAHSGRPRAVVSLGHEHSAEQRGGPHHHGPAVRRRQRHAHPSGDGARHRRRHGPARPGQAADRLSHERGP